MLPNPMMPPGGGGEGPVPVGPGPKASPDQEGGSPEEIKNQLKMLLMKAKEIAEQNGVNFSDVVAEVEGAKKKADIPLPRPPQPEM